MSGIHLEYPDPDASDHSAAAHDLQRQEPNEDDDRGEDEGNDKGDGHDDDRVQGYSE
jgi:hypothetical protein